jgi:Protein of unknown function (DUF2817)
MQFNVGSPEVAAAERFSRDYATARARFLDLAEKARLPLRTYRNPTSGPEGEMLATDVVLQGPADATNLLVTISATHGAEGFCGSGCQADWLVETANAALPPRIAILHVHAINPYGFAWLRRVTEENVDLNRNFLDFSRNELPENREYDALADAFVPASLDPDVVAAGEARIRAFREQHGDRALQSARSGGQYKHPKGIFYGGVEPTWARKTLEQIVADYNLGARRQVAVIDYHTGLGSYGYGELICDHDPGTPNLETALAWYGESVTVPLLGTSASVPKHGTAGVFWERRCGARAVYNALEYGTFNPERGRGPMREDHVLHAAGNVDWKAPETQRIKRNLRRHFFPDTQPWRELVVFRSRQVLSQALRGLAGGRAS